MFRWHLRSRSVRLSLTTLIACMGAMFPAAAHGQFNLKDPPLSYFDTAPDDPVSRLQKRLDAGETKLTFEPHFGYLRSLLRELNLPVASQGLVFSKTSLQVRHISPQSPRAIYFNDDVYLGWVPGGHVEISAVDPRVAANFYLFRQEETPQPKIVRHNYECLQCHGSVMTRDVPGHVVRSVPVGPDGHLLSRGKTFITTHASPLRERWGGWYVSGEHGRQRHLGNRTLSAQGDAADDLDAGANATDLKRWFDTSLHLSPHSDIVALMVLEHQATMHNILARAGFQTRVTMHEVNADAQGDNAAEARAKDIAFAVRQAAEPVVEHLLFADETPLEDKIVGPSGFAEAFSRGGPRDRLGRSLRELDLQTRLFKYPCSYVIHTRAFQELPSVLKDEVYRQLHAALRPDATAKASARLSAADRQAVREILAETLSDLPANWK
jgi:hypothetical protein